MSNFSSPMTIRTPTTASRTLKAEIKEELSALGRTPLCKRNAQDEEAAKDHLREYQLNVLAEQKALIEQQMRCYVKWEALLDKQLEQY
jgi:hypothetical protein